MQEDVGLTPAERELEAALQSLQPARLNGGRDRVIFQAGYARGRRQGRIWQAASGCLGLALVASVVWQAVPSGVGHQPDVTVAHGQPAAPATTWATDGREVWAAMRSGPGMDVVRFRIALLERDTLSTWRPIPCNLWQAGIDCRPLEELASSM